MDSQKEQQTEVSKPLTNINIDINGDQDDSGAKNSMHLDTTTNENRVGLSKEELMKYANQPFWVRLRNILFASFWIVWVSILIAAIGYVIHSPGCTKLVSASSLKTPETLAPASSSSG